MSARSELILRHFPLLPLVLGFRLGLGLPLHVRGRLRAAALERDHVIDQPGHALLGLPPSERLEVIFQRNGAPVSGGGGPNQLPSLILSFVRNGLPQGR